jgi:glycosyltransferase involved in cell wall biosynthesis
VVPVLQEVPEQDMPRLYAAVDAFVLPTRGEGFGMPIMEAMSMVRSLQTSSCSVGSAHASL